MSEMVQFALMLMLLTGAGCAHSLLYIAYILAMKFGRLKRVFGRFPFTNPLEGFIVLCFLLQLAGA